MTNTSILSALRTSYTGKPVARVATPDALESFLRTGTHGATPSTPVATPATRASVARDEARAAVQGAGTARVRGDVAGVESILLPLADTGTDSDVAGLIPVGSATCEAPASLTPSRTRAGGWSLPFDGDPDDNTRHADTESYVHFLAFIPSTYGPRTNRGRRARTASRKARALVAAEENFRSGMVSVHYGPHLPA